MKASTLKNNTTCHFSHLLVSSAPHDNRSMHPLIRLGLKQQRHVYHNQGTEGQPMPEQRTHQLKGDGKVRCIVQPSKTVIIHQVVKCE